MLNFIALFNELLACDVVRVGGKGASLGEMTQAGIAVPAGFVITTNVFDEFLVDTDLNVEIDAILGTVDQEVVHTVDDASEKIRTIISQIDIPQNIADEILQAYRELGAGFVAVRSSATLEDSKEAAWAGQLESYLNTTEDVLLENVKKCWSSLFTPRAIFYRCEKGLMGCCVSVAVVVQKMVQSEISGIAFSVHPVTQDYNQLIVEAGFGLGESIVSGLITPDSYVVDKSMRTIVDTNITVQKRGMFLKDGGGNEWRNLAQKEGGKPTLSNNEVLELVELVIGIEEYYGFPVDVEWAREGGKFYIMQSRSITTLKL